MAMPIKAEPGSTIAVLGASTRAAAFSLLRAGYRVVAADLFADADLAKRCSVTRINTYPQGFVGWLKQTECDAWIYTGALENYPELIEELASLKPLLGNQAEALHRSRDPLLLQDALNNNGFSFPKTIAKDGPSPLGGRWIGKSYRGSSGSGVGPLVEAPYRQQFISGTPLSAVFNGKTLLGITRQLVGESWTGAAEFQYCGSIGPWHLPPEMEKELKRLGAFLHQEFNLVCWYGVDLILTDKQLWVIEINPRYTASMEIVERCQQESDVFIGKAILFAKQPLTIDAKLSESLLSTAGELPRPTLADIPRADTHINVGQPVLTLFCEAASINDTLTALKQNVTALRKVIASDT